MMEIRKTIKQNFIWITPFLLLLLAAVGLFSYEVAMGTSALFLVTAILCSSLWDAYKVSQGRYTSGTVVDVIDKVRVSVPDDNDAVSNYDMVVKVESTGEIVTFYVSKLKRPKVGERFNLMPDDNTYCKYRILDENPTAKAWANVFIILIMLAMFALGGWYLR